MLTYALKANSSWKEFYSGPFIRVYLVHQGLLAKVSTSCQLAEEHLFVCLLIKLINSAFSLDNNVEGLAFKPFAHNVLILLVSFAISDMGDFGNFIIGQVA